MASAFHFFNSSLNLIQPFLISETKNFNELIFLLLILVVEFPAMICSYMVIDSPDYGRTKLLLIVSLGQFSVLGSLFLGKESTLVIGLMLVYFLNRITNLTIYTISVETYNTIYRSRGVGASYMIGSLIGSLAPYVIWPCFLVKNNQSLCFKLDKYLPLLVLSLV